MTTEPRQTCSINAACAIVSVSRRTLYHWLQSGKVEFIRTAGGSPRIFVDSLWRPGTAALPVLDTERCSRCGLHRTKHVNKAHEFEQEQG